MKVENGYKMDASVNYKSIIVSQLQGCYSIVRLLEAEP